MKAGFRVSRLRRRWLMPGLMAILVILMSASDVAPAVTVPDFSVTTFSPSPSMTHSTHALHVVALGDSVTKGAGCACAPFPDRYAASLSQRWHRVVQVDNFGVNGLDSTGLLGQLADGVTARAVSSSNVVVITIGANDFEPMEAQVFDGTCVASGGTDCLSGAIDQLKKNVTDILARVRALRRGHQVTVLVTGYWNVFQDGDVGAKADSTSGLTAARLLTLRANRALREAASSAGATYVDLYRPFQTAHGGITPLLSSDGDHPSSEGDALLAATLLRYGLPEAFK